jgi:membrane dipeptidase
VSYVTLTHAKDNAICDSSYDESKTHGGLSAFGKRAVAELNRVGIMVDVSHVSDASFYQAIERSAVPVIASHSSLRHFVPGFQRNVSDDMLRALAGKGGVILINFGSTFLLPASNEAGKKQWEAAAAFAAKNGLDREKKADRVKIDAHAESAVPMVYANVSDVADHIDRVKALVGIEHVGLGSDFDGVGDSLPEGLKDASSYPNLIRLLLERGYTEPEIEKICSGNVLRVWQAALDHARG